MQRWRVEDKELVINTLSARAHGMFRWVYCQLDTLCRCFPPSIRKALDELPITLDATYERMLEGIPREKKEYAHRLFQCLVAAIRPLRVEELAEIFTIDFNQPNLVERWRPEDPGKALLSACSTLIVIVGDGNRKIVQFSHFSVKEFLTSDRLRISNAGNIQQYYIPLDGAHTLLARACLTVLLQLDENVDDERIATFPLAFYAAKHWVDHAKFEDVASRVQDAMECLFNPSNPYLTTWNWLFDIEWGSSRRPYSERPLPLRATSLYYATLCGFAGLAKHLIIMHSEDVNVMCIRYGTPLHAASSMGHLDTACVSLDHGADVNTKYEGKGTPLCAAYDGNHHEVMRLLLEHGADPGVPYGLFGFLLHNAVRNEAVEIGRLLLQNKADVNARNDKDQTPLHIASIYAKRNPDIVRLLLEYGADVNVQSASNTPLRLASAHGNLETVRLLLGHGADVHIRGKRDMTPLHIATERGHDANARLLLEHGAENV
ncbi:ankyrin repeat-containing domain protein [Russula brevipes]|nr:ankyrin repeat-containing domain protein [Russula brevipes]